MTYKDFILVISDQINISKNLLLEKGREYAENAELLSNIDRLAAFKKAGALQGVTAAEAAFGMLAKHIVSISDMVSNPEGYDLNRWTEKLSDSINYLLILKAIATEAHDAMGEVADHA